MKSLMNFPLMEVELSKRSNKKIYGNNSFTIGSFIYYKTKLDKGRGFVILNKHDYINSMNKIISDVRLLSANLVMLS